MHQCSDNSRVCICEQLPMVSAGGLHHQSMPRTPNISLVESLKTNEIG